jgi:hypothetical protein
VIHIEFNFFDTCLGPGMIFCRLPGAIEQFHLAEMFYRQATPVIRRPGGLKTAFAVSSVLVTQHPEPPISVPAQ